jgi:carbon-monoxide dehydrogenase medium subunit
MLRLQGGVVADARIALTNAAATALRAQSAENALRGKVVDAASVGEAARLAMSICDPAPDQRGNADYKRAMCGEMTRRAIQAAHTRALKRPECRTRTRCHSSSTASRST